MLTEKYLPVHTGYRRNSDSLRSNRDPWHNGLMIPIETKILPKLSMFPIGKRRKKIFPIDYFDIFLITNFQISLFFFTNYSHVKRHVILYMRDARENCSIVRIKRSSRRNWTTKSRTSLSLSLTFTAMLFGTRRN